MFQNWPVVNDVMLSGWCGMAWASIHMLEATGPNYETRIFSNQAVTNDAQHWWRVESFETNGKAMAYEGPKMLSKGRASEEHEGFQMWVGVIHTFICNVETTLSMHHHRVE
jgi:hypothetical protein